MDRGPKFDKLILGIQKKLLGYAINLTKNKSKAEDAVSWTVIRMYEKHESFQEGTQFSAWAFTILRNHVYTKSRTSGREVSDPDGIFASNLTGPDNEQEWAVELKTIQRRMRLLPKPMKMALDLVVEGYTHEEIALMLGVAVGTIKSRVSRARDFLEYGTEDSLKEEQHREIIRKSDDPDLTSALRTMYIDGADVSDMAPFVSRPRQEVMIILARNHIKKRKPELQNVSEIEEDDDYEDSDEDEYVAA